MKLRRKVPVFWATLYFDNYIQIARKPLSN